MKFSLLSLISTTLLLSHSEKAKSSDLIFEDSLITETAIYFMESAKDNIENGSCSLSREHQLEFSWILDRVLDSFNDGVDIVDASSWGYCRDGTILGFANPTPFRNPFRTTVYICKSKFDQDDKPFAQNLRNIAFVAIHEAVHTARYPIGFFGHEVVTPTMRLIDQCSEPEQTEFLSP